MKKWHKVGLILLIAGTAAYLKFGFFADGPKHGVAPDEQKTEQVAPKPEETDENAPKSYVSIYFIGQNDKQEEVYKIVKRKYSSENGTKLKVAIKYLLKGPSRSERAKGIYSEIPAGTKLLSLQETPDKVVINLTGNFEQGGGTDGIYKRLYQLIKTANKNTALEVYLNVDGKQADVMGGEGIMINQPLNDKSLDEE